MKYNKLSIIGFSCLVIAIAFVVVVLTNFIPPMCNEVGIPSIPYPSDDAPLLYDNLERSSSPICFKIEYAINMTIPFLPAIAFIFGTISLIQIKKTKEKGKLLSWASIMAASIIYIFFLVNVLLNIS